METRANPPQKMDRRARRSRRLILDAFAELVPEKGSEKITVKDIVERADIGRATFYAHFEDKADLERFIFNRFLNMIEQEIQNLQEAGDEPNLYQVLLPSLALFRIAAEKFEIFKQSAGNAETGITSLAPALIRRMESKMAAHGIEFQDDVVTVEQLGLFLFSPLLSLLSDWLLQDMPVSPEAMDEVIQSLARPQLERLIKNSV